MRSIRWNEVPEARQAGGPREAFRPGSPDTASVDVVLFFQWPEWGADLPALWHQPTDFLSLEAGASTATDLTTLEERSHRPRKVRQPTWTAKIGRSVFSRYASSIRAGAKISWWYCCGEKSVQLPLRWWGASWWISSGAGRCTSHQSRPCCGEHDGNCEIGHGPFASLNTGESRSPAIWWRSTRRRFACVAASF